MKVSLPPSIVCSFTMKVRTGNATFYYEGILITIYGESRTYVKLLGKAKHKFPVHV